MNPELPNDMTRKILFLLSPNDMINYCTTHKEKLSLCSDNAFLTNYVYNNYNGLDFNSIKYSGTNWEKFLFIKNLVDRMRKWTEDDIIEYTVNIQGHSHILIRSSILNDILYKAIQTDSSELLRYLIIIYQCRVSILFDRIIEKLMSRDMSHSDASDYFPRYKVNLPFLQIAAKVTNLSISDVTEMFPYYVRGFILLIDSYIEVIKHHPYLVDLFDEMFNMRIRRHTISPEVLEFLIDNTE